MKQRKRQRRGKGGKLNKTQKREVKTLVARRAELKFFLSQTNNVAIGLTPTVTQVSPIPQGDSDQTRDGDRLYLKSFLVNGSIIYADVTNFVRFIMFQWKPNSVPTNANILLPGPSGIIDVYSHFNHDLRQQYKVLYDKLYHLEGNGSQNSTIMLGTTYPLTTTSQRVLRFKRWKFAKQLQYAGGGTTGTNQIYIMFLSDSGAAPNPALNLSIKFFFTDS